MPRQAWGWGRGRERQASFELRAWHRQGQRGATGCSLSMPPQSWAGEGKGGVSAGTVGGPGHWGWPLALRPGHLLPDSQQCRRSRVEDFALILVTLPSTQALGNTLIFLNQYLLRLQRIGLGNCRLMNGSKAAREGRASTPRPGPPSPPNTHLSTFSAPPMDNLAQAQTHPNLPHPKCPVPWGEVLLGADGKGSVGSGELVSWPRWEGWVRGFQPLLASLGEFPRQSRVRFPQWRPLPSGIHFM